MSTETPAAAVSPSYQRIAALTFEDMDALQAGLSSQEGQTAIRENLNEVRALGFSRGR